MISPQLEKLEIGEMAECIEQLHTAPFVRFVQKHDQHSPCLDPLKSENELGIYETSLFSTLSVLCNSLCTESLPVTYNQIVGLCIHWIEEVGFHFGSSFRSGTLDEFLEVAMTLWTARSAMLA